MFYDAAFEEAADAYDMELMNDWKSRMDRAGYRAESDARLAVVESEIAMFMDEIDAEREAEEREDYERERSRNYECDHWGMFDND